MTLHRYRCRYSIEDRWGQNWKSRHQHSLDGEDARAGIFWPFYLTYLIVTESVLFPMRVTDWVRRAKQRQAATPPLPPTLPTNYVLTSTQDYRRLKLMIQAFEEKLPIGERE
jgi:hypothetical protein